MTKYPTGNNLMEEGFMFGHTQSIMAGRACQQELEAAGDTASTVKKQREINAAAQITLHLNEHTPKAPSQTCPEVCLPGDSRCC